MVRSRSDKLLVYFDHGDRDKYDNVFACKGFYGETVRNVNRLADIDLVVADRQRGALILVEIEERQSSPKKIIGDVFAIAMCNHVGVGAGDQESFAITDMTKLLVGGVIPTNGVRKQKIDGTIAHRLKNFQRTDVGLDLVNVALFFSSDISHVLSDIRKFIEQSLV